MTVAGKRKITVGFAIQIFDDDNKCVEQEFVAGDTVDYEDAKGNSIEPWDEHHPFDMVQPGDNERRFQFVDKVGRSLVEIVNSIARTQGDEGLGEDIDYGSPDVMKRLAELQQRLMEVKANTGEHSDGR